MNGRTRMDERGITPVVGIVLLVAITVLLAGTAGAFFFGFADRPAEVEQPTVAFEFEDSVGSGDDTVTVKHTSGEKVLAKNLYVKVTDAECAGGSGSPDGRYNVKDDFDFPAEEMGAGMSFQFGADMDLDGNRDLCTGGGTLDLSDATLTVVWENADGSSGTYKEWQNE